MADIEALMAQDRAAREFTVACGPRSYTLRLPTDAEQELAYRRCRRDQPKDALHQEFGRELLALALVGWTGVRAGDLVPDLPKPDEPVPFKRQGVSFLLDRLPEDAAQLGAALDQRLLERLQVAEAAEKNSPRTSPSR